MTRSIMQSTIFAVLACLLSTPTFLMACQDDDKSSRRETAIIKKIEETGGRVYRISAADTSREISFNLSSNPITDDHLKEINSVGEVIWLNLAGTKITNEGLKLLKGMPLKKLHLERTAISDAGMEHLTSFKELEYLNIYDTQVSNKAIKHLKQLKSLKKLYVWKSKINEKGIARLQKQLPNAEVVGELKLEPVVVEEPKKKKMKKEEPKKKVAEKEQPKRKKQEGKKKAAELDKAKTEKKTDKK